MSSVQSQRIAGVSNSADDVPAMGRLPRQLSQHERELFASAGQRIELDAGRAVFRRGEFGRSMFVIESGRSCRNSRATCPTS